MREHADGYDIVWARTRGQGVYRWYATVLVPDGSGGEHGYHGAFHGPFKWSVRLLLIGGWLREQEALAKAGRGALVRR